MAEGGVAQQERQSGGGNRYKAILSNRSVNLLATFALIYTGTEVTLGGALCWLVRLSLKLIDQQRS